MVASHKVPPPHPPPSALPSPPFSPPSLHLLLAFTLWLCVGWDCMWSGPRKEVFVVTLMAPPPLWSPRVHVVKAAPPPTVFPGCCSCSSNTPPNLHQLIQNVYKKQRYVWRQNATEKWITVELLPPTPLSRSWLSALWFFFFFFWLKVERFFGSRPKAFKRIPSAS